MNRISLYCLSFLDLQLLISSLVSSILSFTIFVPHSNYTGNVLMFKDFFLLHRSGNKDGCLVNGGRTAILL
jgi:hypothetical protein